MPKSNAPDMYVWTDGEGNTVVGADVPLPWKDLDELLARRYPLAFAGLQPSPVDAEEAPEVQVGGHQ